MHKIETLAFVVTNKTYSLALATMPPDFALLPLTAVYGCFIVLNDVITPKAKHYGRVVAYSNARYKVEDFYNTFETQSGENLFDGQLHTVHRI